MNVYVVVQLRPVPMQYAYYCIDVMMLEDIYTLATAFSKVVTELKIFGIRHSDIACNYLPISSMN